MSRDKPADRYGHAEVQNAEISNHRADQNPQAIRGASEGPYQIRHHHQAGKHAHHGSGRVYRHVPNDLRGTHVDRRPLAHIMREGV